MAGWVARCPTFRKKMNIGDLVLVLDCPQETADVYGIITGVDYDANDFSGDLDANLYRVHVIRQNLVRYFTNRNLILLSENRRENDNLR